MDHSRYRLEWMDEWMDRSFWSTAGNWLAPGLAALISVNAPVQEEMKRKRYIRPLSNGFEEKFQWNQNDKSEEVNLLGDEQQIALFHPSWSNGAAGVRCNKAINRHKSKCYWEILVKDRLFGTSMMFGISTRSARLHCDSYINLIGENEFGWGLSHKGLIWHNGQWKIYTKPFRENKSTVIGCLYDDIEGTLTYYKDGVCLGVAFTGLNLVPDNLYPTISSTASKTEFVLKNVRLKESNLKERCRAVVRRHLHNEEALDELRLPSKLISFIKMDEEDDEYELVEEPHYQPSAADEEIELDWPTISFSKKSFQSHKIPMPDL